MAKTALIVAVLGCIHIGDKEHVPGGKPFECEAKEAKRLIKLGVAALATEKDQTQSDDDSTDDNAKADLLAAIAAAETVDALQALMPEAQPDDEIAAAFVAKMTELEEA